MIDQQNAATMVEYDEVQRAQIFHTEVAVVVVVVDTAGVAVVDTADVAVVVDCVVRVLCW